MSARLCIIIVECGRVACSDVLRTHMMVQVREDWVSQGRRARGRISKDSRHGRSNEKKEVNGNTSAIAFITL